MIRLAWSLVTKVAPVALIGLVAWQGWKQFELAEKREKLEIDAAHVGVAEEVLAAIVEDLRTHRGSLREVALLRFEGDPANNLTAGLRASIEQSGVLDLDSRGWSGPSFDTLSLHQPSFGDVEEAVAEGRSRGAAAVLFGKVNRFGSVRHGAAPDVEIGLADVGSGQVVFRRQYAKDGENGTPAAASEHDEKGTAWFVLLLAWILLVILLPVFTLGFLRTMVRERANVTNAFALGAYTLMDMLLAYLLFGVSGAVPVVLVGYGAASVGSLVYNMQVMTFLVKLED